MKIAICDDQHDYNKKLHKMLKDYIQANKIDSYEIREYTSGLTLLEEYSLGKYDFIFLDVEMPNLNGFKTAERIRHLDLNTAIIFVTHIDSEVQQGYIYNAKAYLYKNVDQQQIDDLMDRIINEHKRKQIIDDAKYTIRLKGGGEVNLLLADVLYFESKLHYINVVTVSDCYTFKKKLDQVEEELKEKGFVRAQRSYLVNMAYIFTIAGLRVKWKKDIDKHEILITRKYKESAIMAFNEYRGVVK